MRTGAEWCGAVTDIHCEYDQKRHHGHNNVHGQAADHDRYDFGYGTVQLFLSSVVHVRTSGYDLAIFCSQPVMILST